MSKGESSSPTLPPAGPAGTTAAAHWWRALLGVLALAFAAMAIWLGTHVSQRPRFLGRWSAPYGCLVLAVAGVALLLAAGQFGAFSRALHAARFKVMAVLFPLFGSLGLAEVLVRILDPFQISSLAEVQRYNREAKVADARASYLSRPNMRAVFQGVEVATNELGLRDRPFGPKPPGEYRVLALGDSVTFGWGVEGDKTYLRQLEELLASRLRRPVRTLNTGCDSYNTDDELGILEKFSDTFAPDLVILLYVYNDVDLKPHPWDPERDYRLSGRSPPEMVRILLWRSWLYRLVRVATLHGSDPDSAQRGPDTVGWKRSMESLRAIAAYNRQRDIRFATFLYRMDANPTTDALRDEITSIAARESFHFCDGLPWFAVTDPRNVRNSVVDSHPNAEGHRLIALGMERFLAEKRLLPQ